MKPLQYTILAALGGAIAVLGLNLSAFGFLAPIGGFLFLGGLSALIGRLAFPEERIGLQVAFGVAGALAYLAAAGAAIYYVHRLDAAAIAGILVVSPWVPFVFSAFSPKAKELRTPLADVERSEPVDTPSILLLIAIAVSDIAALRWLTGAATAEPIRTPWEAVPPVFFLWIFLSSAALIALAWRGRYHHLTLAAAALHLFTILSPALLVYAIGFGFDPFIHVATESLIAQTGEVLPKPPYYLGQYALVVLLSKLSLIGVETVDRVLLPFLSAIFLPLGAVYAMRRGFQLDRRSSVLAALGIAAMPLASFVATTPQGLANLFAVLTALLAVAWTHDKRPSLLFLLVLAAGATAIHPIAGIPAFCYLLIAIYFNLRSTKSPMGVVSKAVFGVAAILGAAFVLPAMFLAAEGADPALVVSRLMSLPSAVIAWIASLPAPETPLPTRFRPALDFAEAALRIRPLLILGFAIGGIALLWRKPGYRKTAATVLAAGAAFLAGALMLKSGFVFADVISYEQQNYGDRVFELALLLLLPAVLAGAAWWWRSLDKADGIVRVFHALLFAAVMTVSAYAAFPRNDAYVLGRSRATSIHDIAAVRSVEERAEGPHVVLANQAVSAAALKETGFKTYFGDQYYYPIPTGAPLYQHYLDMVYASPSRMTMESAMRSVGVAESYFIINDYWTDSERIIAEAKKTADGWWPIDGGRLHVFEYRLR